MDERDDLFGRVPPFSNEAERTCLGCVLLDEKCIDILIEMLEERDFYKEGHRLVFMAMCNMSQRGQKIDVITLDEELKRTNKIEGAGGTAYVTGLSDGIPTSYHVKQYANIVREKAVLRRMIVAAQDIAFRAHDDVPDFDSFIDEANAAMFEACSHDVRSAVVPFNDISKEAFGIIEKISSGEITGIPTGFKDFDNLTGGLQGGDLIIIAGRPGLGKTTFASNIAVNAAKNNNVASLFFSIEMNRVSLGIRSICAESGISTVDIREGRVSKSDWGKLIRGANIIGELPILVDDSPRQTALKIKAITRRWKTQKNIGLVIVDYLQLMKGQTTKDGTREQEIASISRDLKIMAKELNIPVVAPCQMNRKIEDSDRRPRLADLRESGAIEQDADVVLFLHKPKEERGLKVEGILAKQRNGPTGIFDLAFLDYCNRFENYKEMEK
jgi:replicative DNA helicase